MGPIVVDLERISQVKDGNFGKRILSMGLAEYAEEAMPVDVGRNNRVDGSRCGSLSEKY